MKNLGKLTRHLGPLLGVFIFGIALWVLHRQLTHLHWHDITSEIKALPIPRVLWALGLTVLAYLVLTGYDLLGMRYLKQDIPARKTMLASFISYVFTFNVGLSVIGASTVRFRFYTAWGIPALAIVRLIIFAGLSSWLGIFALTGVVFLFSHFVWPESWHIPLHSGRPLGVAALILVFGYILLCRFRRKPLLFGSWEWQFPSWNLAISQIAVGMLDWALAAVILFVLIPPAQQVPMGIFVSAYLLAHILGMLSHVPGGLGIFETIMLLLLKPYIPAPSLLSAILVYRVIYYLLPLLVAAGAMSAFELQQHQTRFWQFSQVVARKAGIFVPQILAFLVFVTGAILLFSGALPASGGRLRWVSIWFPLPAIEISHFLGSLLGVGLLFLAHSLLRRINAAYFLTIVVLSLAIVLSLIKGLSYHQVIVAGIVLLVLLPCRREFYRHATLFRYSMSRGWLAAVTVVILTFLWLGFFIHKHVEYRSELWWQFSLDANAPRFLRASVGVVLMALLLALLQLMKPATLSVLAPSATDREFLEGLVYKSKKTYAYLALLGDKYILFNPDKTAFIMYGSHGRSWIAMGDPIGYKTKFQDLLWTFRENAHRSGAFCAFYQVDPDHLPLYIDLGLSLQKLGEEAHLPLRDFSLQGGDRQSLRHEVNRAEKDGCRFEVVPREQVPPILSQCKTISDQWLANKNKKEIGFSLGFFNENYLSYFPLAVVRKGDDIIGFANLWLGADHRELSPDLMRYSPDASRNLMTYLFVQTMLWGKEQGYEWFNLGMAPLAGLEARPLAPFWNRIGNLIFRHGEHFYHYEGLRDFKQKFNPIWTPKYLACPNGLALPRIFADLITLIAGPAQKSPPAR